MANTVIGTHGTHQRQERYTDSIVKLMRKSMKVRNTFSRDYVGDPKAGAVKVPVRSADVSLADYDVKDGATLAQSATTYQTIAIENDKAVNELIDGYEAAAVPDNLVAQRIESASYVTAKSLEDDAVSTLANNSTASTASDCTIANCYGNILADINKLAKLGIDKNKLYVAISYEVETMLMQNPTYANTAANLTAEEIREGFSGKINGVKVITQDLGTVSITASGTTSQYNIEYIVYATEWCQAIDEFVVDVTVNDLKDGKHIGASALQGRMVYANAVTNTGAVILKRNSTANA